MKDQKGCDDIIAALFVSAVPTNRIHTWGADSATARVRQGVLVGVGEGAGVWVAVGVFVGVGVGVGGGLK